MRKLMIAAVAAASLLTAASAANAAANHPGRHRLESQPSSPTGENPLYAMGWIATPSGWVYYRYSYSYSKHYDIFGVLWCY
jgi:opacity protein-like surface antigen